MSQELVMTTLVVRDYDEAIDFYTEKLGFELLEDTPQSEVKRWVRIQPPGAKSGTLLLAKAKNEQELAAVGNQTGGRVFLFIHTTDFQKDYDNLLAHDITIVRGPVDEPYGRVLVFEDLYGNLIDLIQPV